jgi:hypothetical protein
MSWIGGATGIASGSAYAMAQSASMGGTIGVIGTIGNLPIVLVTVGAPAVVIGGVYMLRLVM